MTEPEIKKALFQACGDHIEKRITTIQQRLKSIEEARNEETKSSAGDKYETGRAMMQMEEDKAKVQLSEAILTQNTLSKITLDPSSDKVKPGSLVKTNKGFYFLAIGIGKLTIEGQVYYAVSTQSPIGKILLHQKSGADVTFNGMKITIEQVY